MRQLLQRFQSESLSYLMKIGGGPPPWGEGSRMHKGCVNEPLTGMLKIV